MDDLPVNWVIKECREYPGRVYYYNKVTNISTWIRPAPIHEDQIWPPTMFFSSIKIEKVNTGDKKNLKKTNKAILRKIKNLRKWIKSDPIDKIIKRLPDFSFYFYRTDQVMTDGAFPDGEKKKTIYLGWYKRGEMPPDIEHVAFGLDVGELSEPIEVDDGLLLLYRNE